MRSKYVALLVPDYPHEKGEYVELISGVSEFEALKAIDEHCRERGIEWELGYRSPPEEGFQQIQYADGIHQLVIGNVYREDCDPRRKNASMQPIAKNT